MELSIQERLKDLRVERELTLEGELTASYQTVDPNDTSKTLTKSLKSGESVTGLP